MAATKNITFRVLLTTAFLMFLVQPPCTCSAVASKSDASCCSSQAGVNSISGRVPPTHGCGQCGTHQSSSSSGNPRPGLCCSSCVDECKQADAASWDLGGLIRKQDRASRTAVKLPSTTDAYTQIQESPLIPERASPPSSRPIYASIHLLRI